MQYPGYEVVAIAHFRRDSPFFVSKTYATKLTGESFNFDHINSEFAFDRKVVTALIMSAITKNARLRAIRLHMEGFERFLSLGTCWPAQSERR